MGNENRIWRRVASSAALSAALLGACRGFDDWDLPGDSGPSEPMGGAGDGGSRDPSAGGRGATESGGGGAGDAGEAGSTGASGSGGVIPDPRDPGTLIPTCISSNETPTPVAEIEPVGDIAVSANVLGASLQVFATQPNRNVLVTSSPLALNGDGPWSPWSCFDAVWAPRAVEVLRLASSTLEVFALTRGGIASRIYFPNVAGWGQWTEFVAPRFPPEVTSLAVQGLPLDQPHVVVVDRGEVFFRYRSSAEDPYSPYTPWERLSGLDGVRLVTTGVSSFVGDPGLRIYALNEDGLFFEDNPVTGHRNWIGYEPSDFGIADMATGEDPPGILYLYAVTAEGVLMRSLGYRVSLEWERLEAPLLKTIAVHSVGRERPALFGIGVDGAVHWSPNGGDEWRLLQID